MRIKKSSIDTFLVMLVMFVTILPLFIAKQLVTLSLLFLVLRIVTSEDIFFYTKKKIIIFILFMSGIFGAFLLAPEHIVRYLGILLIVLGFPFSSFKIKQSSIMVLSGLIILYLTITQILLLQGNQIILNFRDFAYYYEGSEVHKNYGTTDNIFKNLIDFSYWKIRGGGLYSNPNTLSGVVIMYYFIFDISSSHIKKLINQDKKKWLKYFQWFIFLLVAFCLMTTKSKTFLIAFIAYIIFEHFETIDLLRFRFKKKVILPFIFGMLILSLFFRKIIEGVLGGGSANIKYSILMDYFESANVLALIFGSTYNIFFDTEYGYWFGAAGFLGIFAFYNFYKMVYQFSPNSKALIISFLLISLGASLFYNLLLVSILIPLFIVLLSSSKKLNE
tara:strand:+ start:79 stop:1245 length:1167 start_codon:yes stop_codon:yes gene_type:complete